MSTIIMRLHLPEPKVRKRAVRAVQKHKDKTRYTRKLKHKATDPGGLVLGCSRRLRGHTGQQNNRRRSC